MEVVKDTIQIQHTTWKKDGYSTKDPEEVVELLSNYFCNIERNLAKTINTPYKHNERPVATMNRSLFLVPTYMKDKNETI